MVDYYSTKVLSARYHSFTVGRLLHEGIIRPVWQCFSTDMIYTICWWTTTPRRYDSVSVRTWFIRYVGRLLLHEGMTVFQYGQDLYDMLVDYYTVVKELRSKMFGQHLGYFKAVFVKQTRIIIVSIYKYTVYIMFWIMMLYDCYYY